MFLFTGILYGQIHSCGTCIYMDLYAHLLYFEWSECERSIAQDDPTCKVVAGLNLSVNVGSIMEVGSSLPEVLLWLRDSVTELVL